MAYRALYRLYRPQTFDEVVGQKYIIQTLKNAIKEDRIAHAYLFTGPRGTGKTTIAKLLAKGVNCSNPDYKPCDECESCKSIAAGTHPDVIEIDAASNNSVDEVRDLIDKVKYAPIEGKYKIYIIDEVHMMTPSAFNALLKTLEEPPANVVFILATTEVHKVLPTIISRCQRFDFGRIATSEIERRITRVLEEENISFEPGVVSLVASLADGGVRDALGILDQTIAYAGRNLKEQHVRDIYGVVSIENTIDFLNTCISSNVEKALETIVDFDKKGIDLIRLTSSMVDILKELIVFHKTGSSKTLKLMSFQQAEELSNNLDSKIAFEYIDILMEASATYRRINAPRTYFELAVLKMCNIEKQKDQVREVVTKVETVVTPKKEVKEEVKVEIKPAIKPAVDNVEPSKVEQPIAQPKTIEAKPEVVVEPIKPQVKMAKPVVKNFEVREEHVLNFMVQATKEDKSFVTGRWNLIRKYIQQPTFKKAASLLLDSGPIVCGPKGIIISFDMKARADAVISYENYFAVKDFLKELLGGEYFFIAISDSDFKTHKLHYINLMGKNNLPGPQEFADLYERVDEVIVEEKAEADPILEMGKNIFGDLLKVED